MRTVFTTRDVHPRDRFDYWHDVACKEIVDHESFPVSRAKFEAEIEVGSVGPLDLVAFQNSPLRVEHGRAHISRTNSEHLFLCQETSGVVSAEQEGRQITLHAGQMMLLDPALPYSASFAFGSRALVLKLPRRELQTRVGNTRSMIAHVFTLDSMEHRLVSSFTAGLPALAGQVRPVCGQLVAHFMLDLVALSLAKAVEGTARVPSSKAMTILQIRAVIKARLADPRLDVQSVADAVGLSVRYANSILASQDTSIGRLILHERLERCRRALQEPVQSARSVSEIAFGWGFSDLTHFGRRFKKAYGMSPSDYQLSHRKASSGRGGN